MQFGLEKGPDKASGFWIRQVHWAPQSDPVQGYEQGSESQTYN